MKYKVIVILLNFFFLSYLSVAQSNNFPKLEDLFKSGEYLKCIDKSKKYSDKDKKQALPYIYSAFSYFELYKLAEKESIKNKYLKKALSNAKKGKAKDKESIFEEQFKDNYLDLQKETHKFANETYLKQKEKSTSFYNYLASIYQDTTNQYKELNGLLEANSSNIGIDLAARSKIGPNVIDENGLKQGLWRKIYPNGEIAYEVRFKDDNPIGVFKRFHENGNISVLMDYGNDGSKFSSVTMYSKRGNIMATGFYKEKLKDSIWSYYSSNKKLAEFSAKEDQAVVGGPISYIVNEVNYKNGKKEGVERKFHTDGSTAQLITWKEDLLHGTSKEFFKDGNIKSDFTNKEDKRAGSFKQYFTKGKIEIEGFYDEGTKHGKWKYYKTSGEIEKEVIYNHGIADNQDELDDEQTKRLQEAEKNKGKLEDPEKYQNDPDKFLRGF